VNAGFPGARPGGRKVRLHRAVAGYVREGGVKATLRKCTEIYRPGPGERRRRAGRSLKPEVRVKRCVRAHRSRSNARGRQTPHGARPIREGVGDGCKPSSTRACSAAKLPGRSLEPLAMNGLRMTARQQCRTESAYRLTSLAALRSETMVGLQILQRSFALLRSGFRCSSSRTALTWAFEVRKDLRAFNFRGRRLRGALHPVDCLR